MVVLLVVVSLVSLLWLIARRLMVVGLCVVRRQSGTFRYCILGRPVASIEWRLSVAVKVMDVVPIARPKTMMTKRLLQVAVVLTVTVVEVVPIALEVAACLAALMAVGH
jgi:hypothetical protein